jgi:hypothetical protein
LRTYPIAGFAQNAVLARKNLRDSSRAKEEGSIKWQVLQKRN